MPLYDYYCEKCEKVMEDVVCKVNKEAHCKVCGETMTRMVNCKTFKLLYDPKKDTVG
jgi:putative FmdB family regulatory protein